MRAHTAAEAAAVIDIVERWQEVFARPRSARCVYAADEYYLLAGREPSRRPRPTRVPPARERHRHGPGLRAGLRRRPRGGARGAATASSLGRRAPRRSATARPTGAAPAGRRPTPRRAVTVLTGAYGARVLGPLLAGRRADVRVVAGREPVLRRQHRRWRACSPGPTWPGRSAARTPTATLPAARRLPLGGQVPRRHDADDLAPTSHGRDRRCLAAPELDGASPRTGSAPSMAPPPSTPLWSVAGRPNVGQVLAGQPDRRPPGGRGRGGAGGDPGPQGRSTPSGPASPSPSSTPAAGWPAGRPRRQGQRPGRAGAWTRPTWCCSWSTSPWG